MDDLPHGFEPYREPSPFLERIGPLYQKNGDPGPIFGVPILDHHCNRRGFAHGGLLMSLADIALGKTGEWSQQPRMSLLTASLTIEFVGAARIGDWIEATCDFHQLGRQMAFANCYLTVGNRRIARASGVFRVGERAP